MISSRRVRLRAAPGSGSAWIAALVSAAVLVVGAGVPATAAERPAGPALEAEATSVSSLPSSAGVTVGGTNTVAADVLGLG
ncbi:hypothetical protein, partial [Agromyces aerolatus]|uniref:hypothetical protein n=1 Tax=Agromyces sp. LY-1074 TaxID=3074080 RepID=UPI002854E0A4